MLIKKKILLPILAIGGIFSATFAKAIPCAVCTIAVGAGVGLARWLKIDDRITGLWVGALLASLVAWTIHYLNKKNIRFRGRKILTVVFWYGLTIVPLYFTGIMGHASNKFLGIDKLLFGVIVGSIIFLIANLLHNYLKRKNNDKSYFPLQKAALPVGFLALISLITYLLTK